MDAGQAHLPKNGLRLFHGIRDLVDGRAGNDIAHQFHGGELDELAALPLDAAAEVLEIGLPPENLSVQLGLFGE